MTQPADAPPAADPSQPPPPAEGPRVRAVSDRRSALERAHDALCDALGMLENEDGHQPDAPLPRALRYARAHLARHIDEKSKSESVAVGVLGALAAGLGGMFVGHVLTKPEETVRRGWLRDLLSSLSPEHKAAGLSALRQAAAVVDEWARRTAMTPEQERAEAVRRAQASTQQPSGSGAPASPDAAASPAT